MIEYIHEQCDILLSFIEVIAECLAHRVASNLLQAKLLRCTSHNLIGHFARYWTRATMLISLPTLEKKVIIILISNIILDRTTKRAAYRNGLLLSSFPLSKRDVLLSTNISNLERQDVHYPKSDIDSHCKEESISLIT